MGWIAAVAQGATSGLQAILNRGGGPGARQQFGETKAAQQNMKDIYGYAFPFAQSTGAAGTATTEQGLGTMQKGLGTLSTAKDYWGSILSGYRPAQMAAVAPEIQSINEASAAQRAQQGAYGTARGGGTSGAAQEAETKRMSAIDQALFGARPVAAQQVGELGQAEAAIGKSQADVGIQQLSAGLRALGLSEEAVNSILSSAQAAFTTQAQASQNTWNAIGKAVGSGSQALQGMIK